MNLNIKKISVKWPAMILIFLELCFVGLTFADGGTARDEIKTYLCGLADDFVFLAFIVAILMGIFVGVRFMAAGGNLQNKEIAKAALNDLIIGVALVVIIPLLVPLIARTAKFC